MDELTLQVLRLALPLVLATLSETVVERSGLVNLGIEGMMLSGALVAWMVAAGEPGGMLLVAWLAAAATGALLGALFWVFAVWRGAHFIVAGTALHFLCLGGTGLIHARFRSPETVTTFANQSGAWSPVPYLVALGLVLGVVLLLRHTSPGLRLVAAGESPPALVASGGSVGRSRLLALLLAGALAGVAGATLTTVLTGQFVEGMSAGRGFLGLSLVVFARWHPLGAVVAGLFLGGAFAAELHLSTWAAAQGQEGTRELVMYLLRGLPYVLTIAALAVTGGPSRAPRVLSGA